MNSTNLKEILKKIEAFNGTLRHEVSSETKHLLELCEEIKKLTDSATSVCDVNFILGKIDEIDVQSFLGLQRNQINFLWKQNLNEMAAALLDGLPSESNWQHLSQHFNGIFHEHASLPFLYNNVRTNGFSIHNESSQKIPRARSKRNEQRNPANLVKPIKVLSQTSDVDSHKQKMKICFDKLFEVCGYDESESIPFFNFVINCKSYVQTVYNIFTTSFLVRERLAIMSIDNNHQLWIRPMCKSTENGHSDKNSQNLHDYDSLHQFIVFISPREWKMLIKRLKLTKSMLPVLWPAVEFSDNKSEFYNEIANGVNFLE